MLDFNPDSDFVYGRPYTPPPPVIGIITDTGMGKTRQWRKQVAVPLVAQGLHPALAVPLHRLGEEVVADFAADGVDAFCFRGRDADDPLTPSHKMCREQERIGAIYSALADVSDHACKRGEKVCPHFATCGYQRQQRVAPQVSVFAHQMLFQKRPSFIRQVDALAIDEDFSGAGLKGHNKLRPEKMWLCLLKGDRNVSGDIYATADLVAASDRVYAVLLRQKPGFLRPAAFIAAGIGVSELRRALQSEWRRKKTIPEVEPGMPLEEVQQICAPVAVHNQEVRLLTTFWDLLIRTLEAGLERSPYLYFNPHERTHLTATNTQPAVRMVWRQDVHPSWLAPTTIMDATMQPEIVRQYFPSLPEPVRITVDTPHTYVRQIIDQPMSAKKTITRAGATEKANRTVENHQNDLRTFIETRANDVRPGRVLVICQKGLEAALDNGTLPDNVELAHLNAIAGQNAWNDVALLILIGRTEPPPRDVEKLARALFDADIPELPAGPYPVVERGVRMRDGGIAIIKSPRHPDERAEAVRWQICEAELIQAIGRGRAVNRSADNPLHIDILTNYALPIVVDELTTLPLILPSFAEIMRSRGAVPVVYRDMADAYPDLFNSRDAAEKALIREIGISINDLRQNPRQTPIENYLIGICRGFLTIPFKRKGFRGPASKLLFDPQRIEPLAWLSERFGEVKLLGKPRQPEPKPRRARRRR